MLTYVVELADDELDVLPIHRLVTGLPDGLDDRRCVEALGPWFVTTEAGPVDERHRRRAWPAAARSVLVDPDGVVVAASPDPSTMAGRARPRLESPRRAPSMPCGIDDVAFQHGVDEVRRRGRRGPGRRPGSCCARPPSAQIVEIAHGGERMPPKTTFFSPKPRTGVVFRLLDE